MHGATVQLMAVVLSSLPNTILFGLLFFISKVVLCCCVRTATQQFCVVHSINDVFVEFLLKLALLLWFDLYTVIAFWLRDNS